MAAAVGRQGLHLLIEVVHDPADERVPGEECRTNARSTEVGRRLMEISGVGRCWSALWSARSPIQGFSRPFAISRRIGLVPKQNSSGGTERLGGITKQGDRYLRQILVVGALAVVRYAVRNGARRPWLVQLLARRTPKVARVALANKTARMVWAIMTSGERYVRLRTLPHVGRTDQAQQNVRSTLANGEPPTHGAMPIDRARHRRLSDRVGRTVELDKDRVSQLCILQVARNCI